MNARTRKYIRQYKWSNIVAMIRNNSRDPRFCPGDFRNRLVVITGATSGIGRATARKYASRGANLLCVNRNLARSEALRHEIESEFGVTCSFLIADLSKLNEVFRVARELAELEVPIDVLIHNAGIFLTHRELTAEGFDKVFAVHHLAPFILNHQLTDKLKAQKKARIIIVGSEGHRFAAWGLRLDDLNWTRRKYTGMKSYGSAKLAQLLAMPGFVDRFRDSGVTLNTMHPGAVKSDTGQENGPVYRWFKKNFLDRGLRSPQVSAEALYWLGVAPELESVSGKFFNLTTREEPAPPALDPEAAAQLWAKTLEMTGLEQKDGNPGGSQT